MSSQGFKTKSKNLMRKKKTKMAMVSSVLVGAMLVSAGFTGTGYSRANVADKPFQQQVIIDVDGKTIKTQTTQTDPSNILMRAGIPLWSGDDYELQQIDDNNARIVIHRAVPVTVTYDGRVKTIQTNKATVEEALTAAGYNLEDYEVSSGLATKITKNMNIELKDSAAVRKAKEEKKPQYESAQMQVLPTSKGYKNVLTMEASAYLPSDGGGSGITASGIPAGYGVVAVDPWVIPLGTRLYIPGYGEAIAADTGGAIHGNKIDLCMEDYASCMQFGRRFVDVYVLD